MASTNDDNRPTKQKRFRSKVGRPSLYKAEFCQLVIELGAKGKSKAQMARDIGVCRQTLENWIRERPEFLDAITHALDYALAWWEDQGQAALFLGHKFNDRAWSFQIRNRFPKDYRDSRELELGGLTGSEPVKLVISAAEAAL
jgi:hypothetical protein